MTEALAENFSWERMIGAVEKVRERLLRTSHALEEVGIPYAVIGGNAVAAWVKNHEEGGVRNTPNVDVIVRREDFPAVVSALTSAGFIHSRGKVTEIFLDGPEGRERSAVRIYFADEKIRPDLDCCPSVNDSVTLDGFRCLELEPLVRMKLHAHRTIDRVHMRDMLDVGLIDASWKSRFAPELAARLQELIDTPEG